MEAIDVYLDFDGVAACSRPPTGPLSLFFTGDRKCRGIVSQTGYWLSTAY